MILFQTAYQKVYNYLIHSFLEIETCSKNVNFDDMVDKLLPDYLRRYQFQECKKAFENLYDWSYDEFNHELTPLHELTLYKFIEYMDFIRKNTKGFRKIYFDQIANNSIREILDKEDDKSELNKLKKQFYNFSEYKNILFNNTDFMIIEKLYNEGRLDNYILKNKSVGDLYYDILPLDLKNKIRIDENIFDEITRLLQFIKMSINDGNLAFMFWEDNIPMLEDKIQIVLENIMDAYFYNQNIDITRESLVGNGKIDFKFYKNKNEKILFEIKKANNTHLKKGYEKQLVQYMKSCQCKKSFYIIMCFTDEDFRNGNRFIKNHEEIDEYQSFIEILLLDVRIKNKVFESINKLKLNDDISEEIDSYFNYIFTILDLSKPLDIINYLDKLRENYYKLNIRELEKEYFKRIREMCSLNIDYINPLDKLFDKENFYKIIDLKNKPHKFVLNLLNDINVEKDIDIGIDLIKEFYSSLNESCDTKRITIKEIKEIFLFLKVNYIKLYNLLSNFNLYIYLFNNINDYSNSECIPSCDLKNFKLICYCMQDSNDYKSGKINPIYVFFYQLGLILSWISLKKYRCIPKNFFDVMGQYLKGLTPNNPDSLIVFADSFAMYVMHNTKYNIYNPFEHFSEQIYGSLNEYFIKLIDELLLEVCERE